MSVRGDVNDQLEDRIARLEKLLEDILEAFWELSPDDPEAAWKYLRKKGWYEDDPKHPSTA